MRFLVVGAGGVGGTLGALLSHQGQEVAFGARGKNLQAMKTHGLKFRGSRSEFDLPKVTVSDDLTTLGTFDVIIVAVKAWQLEELLPQLKMLTRENTLVLPIQNGLGSWDFIKKHLVQGRVIGGICGMVSWIESPGMIRQVGSPPRITLGELEGKAGPEIGQLRLIFEKSGVDAFQTDDFRMASWKKLLHVLPLGLLGAATRSPAGAYRSDAEARKLLVGLIDEIYSVAIAQGIPLQKNISEEVLKFVDSLPGDATVSLQRDLMEGRPSELVEQTSPVLRIALEHRVEVPILSTFAVCLSLQEQTAKASKGKT